MKLAVTLTARATTARAKAPALIGKTSALVSVFAVGLLTSAQTALRTPYRRQGQELRRQGSGRPSAQSSPGSRG